MASASLFLIAANDEHGQNPPTQGKRTPILPYIDRSFYENEYNRIAKYDFLTGLLRCGYNVYDAKPEINDISVSTRVTRINRANPTLLVTFGYNAIGNGATFNTTRGNFVFYGTRSRYITRSRRLAEFIFEQTSLVPYVTGRSIAELTGVGVLESVNCPSVLSEAGFMTNFTEAKLMLDPDFVFDVSEATVRGVCQYLDVNYIDIDNFSAYPTLRRGNRGNKVLLLQYRLRYYGFDINADGVFGAQTEQAVRTFQTNNALSSDGIVGSLTWPKIIGLNPTSTTIRRGSRAFNVVYAQRKLLSKLYVVGELDGVFGAQTERAVREFQSENNLSVDGIIGPKTWAKLSRINEGRPLV